jgi:hypothetical protein
MERARRCAKVRTRIRWIGGISTGDIIATNIRAQSATSDTGGFILNSI